jgi:hypothetical protein
MPAQGASPDLASLFNPGSWSCSGNTFTLKVSFKGKVNTGDSTWTLTRVGKR